jgi:hypothetical protein
VPDDISDLNPYVTDGDRDEFTYPRGEGTAGPDGQKHSRSP